MSTQIFFEEECLLRPSEGWQWIYGYLLKDDKEYPFTILEIYDDMTDMVSRELTWEEDIPEWDSLWEDEIYNLLD
jgi:hypothetical protein